jgi:hypothetical protein
MVAQSRVLLAEVRKLARVRLEREPVGQTLFPTALIHEVNLRLMKNDQPWDSRGSHRQNVHTLVCAGIR